jgi:NADP-dependent 3-hydroxy acid dehydrogenase YdfG
MARPMIVVVGAGPGVGAAVCRRFSSAGYDVGLVARSAPRLESLRSELGATGADVLAVPVDITDAAAFHAGLTELGERHGGIDHLHFNPSVTRMADPLVLTAADLLTDVGLGAASLLTALQAARPFMSAGARITATGSVSADQPWMEATSVGVQKAALRNLVAAIDARLRGDGIRAVVLSVRGLIQPGTEFDPNRIADAVFEASRQPADAWRTELPFPG